MSKSLNARCIRRWELQMRDVCDSKVNPWWRKRDLRGYIRECGLITAYCMVPLLPAAISSRQLAHSWRSITAGITQGRASGWTNQRTQ